MSSLYVFDVNGTLLDKEGVPAELAHELCSLQKAGHMVTVNSSRRWQWATPARLGFKQHMPLVTENGGEWQCLVSSRFFTNRFQVVIGR